MRCPHCGNPCLGFWAKSTLGPAHQKPCCSCGKAVSVSWLWSLPVFILAVPIGTFGSLWLVMWGINFIPSGWLIPAFVIGGVLCTLPLMWFYYRFIPLVARTA